MAHPPPFQRLYAPCEVSVTMAFHGFCTCLRPGNGFLEPVSQPFLKVNGHISEPQVLGLSSPTKRSVEKSKLGSTSSCKCTLQSLFLPPVRFSAGAMMFYGLCAVGMNCSKIIQCYRVYGEAPSIPKPPSSRHPWTARAPAVDILDLFGMAHLPMPQVRAHLASG